MKNKLFLFSVLMIVLSLTISTNIFAQELQGKNNQQKAVTATESNVIPNPDIAPAPTPTPTPTPVPTQRQTTRKKTLRQIYQEKIQTFTKQKQEIQEKPRNIKENIQDQKKELGEQRQEKVQELNQRKEEIRGKLDVQKRERVKTQTDKIGLNFENALKKIEEITQKVQARIETMEERGIDLTEAKNLIMDVPVKIEEARQSVSQMKESFLNSLDSETPKEAFSQSKEMAIATRAKIKEAHQSLIKVVNAIKASIKVRTQTTETTENGTINESSEETVSE